MQYSLRLAALCVLASALVAAPLFAQSTTATIEGRVVGSDGSGMGGVTVVATNLRTGFARSAETDADGNYRVFALPPAPYKVEATKEGLFAQTTEVDLHIGQVVALTIGMANQKVEVVTVTSDAIMNTSETEVSTVVNPEQIRELPTINRDFTDLTRLAPGAKPKQTGQLDPTKNDLMYRPFTIGAGNGREVNISIDGGDNNDVAVGSYMMGLTVEAVQEFEVITDQYKAEYGRASHGVVNVITKSGSNDLEGSVFALYRDDEFRRRNFSEGLAGTPKTPSERKQYGFSIGGPLMKDKLFGFGAYERVEEEEPTSYSPDLTKYNRTNDFAGQSFVTGPERDLYTARVNWNINPNNTAFVRYNRDDNAFLNDQGRAETLVQYNGNSTNETWSALANWTRVIGGNKINELQLHRIEFENGVASNTDPSSIDFITNETYDADILFTLGRNANTPQSTFIEKTQLRDDFTWTLGDHDVKAGFDYVDVEFPDSLLGLPDLFTVNFAFQPSETPDTIDANPSDLARIDEIIFTNPGFLPGSDYKQIGLYVQDSWRANDRWTFYYGVRYDTDDGLFDPQRQGINREFYEAVAASTKDDRPIFERTFPEDPETISPRAGFVHRFKGQDTDVIRGSWGIFHDKMISNLTIFGAQNLSPVFFPSLDALDCDGPGGQCVAGFDIDGSGPVDPLPADFTLDNWKDPSSGLQDWNADNVAILGPLTTFDSQALFIPSPGWEMPATRSYSLGWGHKFNQDWAMDLTALYADGYHQYHRWDVRGTPGGTRNTGIVPATTAARESYFNTNGRSEYTALEGQLRAQKPKYSLIFNVNLSRAEASQDIGASADESGTIDIFSAGNRRYTSSGNVNPYCNSSVPHGLPQESVCSVSGGTCSSDQDCPLGETCETIGFAAGPSCSDEFGPISGDQTVWASVAAIYRLPLGFTVAGDVSYGSEIAFWPNAGLDQNQDGFNSGDEYIGAAGSGEGDSFFQMNVRGTKKFKLVQDLALDIYAEIHNVTNTDNLGLFQDQRQANVDGSRNATYGTPTGNFLGTPRTWNAGLRMTY